MKKPRGSADSCDSPKCLPGPRLPGSTHFGVSDPKRFRSRSRNRPVGPRPTPEQRVSLSTPSVRAPTPNMTSPPGPGRAAAAGSTPADHCGRSGRGCAAARQAQRLRDPAGRSGPGSSWSRASRPSRTRSRTWASTASRSPTTAAAGPTATIPFHLLPEVVREVGRDTEVAVERTRMSKRRRPCRSRPPFTSGGRLRHGARRNITDVHALKMGALTGSVSYMIV